MKIYLLVKQLLEKFPELRNNDKLLHWKVFEYQGLLVNNCLPMAAFVYKAKSTETIRRTRQKIQERFPHLKATSEVQAERKEIERSRGTWVFRDNVAKFIPNNI